mmetsp:Transcript_64995/g.155204  ORF Transcript_64995/g.155204 Transcript_64995/m.155204 type:complete len:221 (-) Transcript_64995:1727-2389(-)
MLSIRRVAPPQDGVLLLRPALPLHHIGTLLLHGCQRISSIHPVQDSSIRFLFVIRQYSTELNGTGLHLLSLAFLYFGEEQFRKGALVGCGTFEKLAQDEAEQAQKVFVLLCILRADQQWVRHDSLNALEVGDLEKQDDVRGLCVHDAVDQLDEHGLECRCMSLVLLQQVEEVLHDSRVSDACDLLLHRCAGTRHVHSTNPLNLELSLFTPVATPCLHHRC